MLKITSMRYCAKLWFTAICKWAFWQYWLHTCTQVQFHLFSWPVSNVTRMPTVFFLDASSLLYKWVCPSLSVRPSISPSIHELHLCKKRTYPAHSSLHAMTQSGRIVVWLGLFNLQHECNFKQRNWSTVCRLYTLNPAITDIKGQTNANIRNSRKSYKGTRVSCLLQADFCFSWVRLFVGPSIRLCVLTPLRPQISPCNYLS